LVNNAWFSVKDEWGSNEIWEECNEYLRSVQELLDDIEEESTS